MSVATSILWTGVTLTAVAATVTTGVGAWRAHDRAETAAARLQTVTGQVERLQSLRATTPAPASDQGSLAQRVTEALASAGLASNMLSNLSPESETSLRETPDGPLTKRRRATLTLTAITLPQVGGFLAAWREREPAWSVASVELSSENARQAPTGGDLPIRAIIVVETLHPAEGPEPSRGDIP